MTERRLSLSEPTSELRRIPIAECAEPLVDFLAHCPSVVLDRPRFLYTRQTLLRASVADRLHAASTLLPAGWRLAIMEGWRAPHIQRRMYRAVWLQFAKLHPEWSETHMRRTVNRFSAPDDRRVPPPHTTGGALDVTLYDPAGQPADFCSPFEPSDPRCYAFDARGLSESARETRAVLAAAMVAAGLTNYPSEFWHWSYGDQGSAYRTGAPGAIYSAITPPGYQPSAEENTDEPLQHAPEI